MKNVLPLMVLLFVGLRGFTQTITPNESTEICPHTNYQNANLTDPRTIQFQINFGSDNASDYEIITFTGDANKPVACKIVSNLSPLAGSPGVGVCYVAFEDQRGQTPAFTTNKRTTGAKKTFKFPFIRCLKGLAPQLIGLQPTPNYPICATGNVVYNTVKNARYKRTDDQTEFGGDIPLYEYSVPKGWKVGNVTSTGSNNFILASPNQVISYDAFNSGDVKVRASQRGYICDGLTTPAAGDWVVIHYNRAALSFTSNGATSIPVTCGVASTHTLTVNNGPNSSCGTYEWNLGSANNNWTYNGSPAPQIITTNTNSITLTTSTCGKPADVTVTLSGANSVFGPVTIPVTMNSQLSISGEDNVCTTRELIIPGLGCNTQVTWESSDPSIATVDGNGGQATVTKVADGVVTITATISGGCSNGTPLTKVMQAGVPTSWYDLFTLEECFQRLQGFEVIAQLTEGPMNSEFEWGYRALEPNATDVVLPNFTSYTAVFRFNQTGVYGIYAKPKNACGAGLKSTRGIVVVESCDELNVLTTSPNPVKSEINVTIDEKHPTLKSEQASKIEFYLYRFTDGQLAKHWSLLGNQSQYRLRLQGVTKGTYVLMVMKGKKKLSKQIFVE